jgi:hypothetical protein
MCDKFKTPGYEGVEVSVDNVNKVQFNLPLDELLQKAKKIIGVEAYLQSVMPIGGVTGAEQQSDAVLRSSFLVLMGVDNSSPIFRIPLIDLMRSINNGDIMQFDIDRININASYIYVSGQSGALDTSKVFFLGFHYQK